LPKRKKSKIKNYEENFNVIFMTIQEIFDLAIKLGRQADPRPQEDIDKQLEHIKRNFDRLSKNEQRYFPREKLTNPYPDSLIHVGDRERKVKKILVTIDATEGKQMIARELGADLVISHHPTGKSLALLGEAMKLQLYVYKKYGVPINIIEGLLRRKIEEVRRNIHAINHYLAVDTARLLKINLMNIHTPADNLSFDFIEKKVEKRNPEYVFEVLGLLSDIPEYQEAARRGSAPKLFAGSPKNHCGRTVVSEFTGGTDGAEKIYSHLATAGVGTVVSMHQPESHRKEAEKSFVNVVIAPHIASDSLGMNLFVDELEKRGIEILPAGGFIRVSRIKDRKGKIANPIG